MLQRKIDGLNKHDEMSDFAAVTLEQMKAKRENKEPPSLCLRPRLLCEKELPLNEQQDELSVLKVTSSALEVLIQRPKLFKRGGVLKPVFTLITVLLHPLMECWLLQLYVPSN